MVYLLVHDIMELERVENRKEFKSGCVLTLQLWNPREEKRRQPFVLRMECSYALWKVCCTLLTLELKMEVNELCLHKVCLERQEWMSEWGTETAWGVHFHIPYLIWDLLQFWEVMKGRCNYPISVICRWGNWSAKRLSDLLFVIQLVGAKIRNQGSDSKFSLFSWHLEVSRLGNGTNTNRLVKKKWQP